MTKLVMLFIASGLVLVGCSPANGNNEKNTPVILDESSTNGAINNETKLNTERNEVQNPPEYLAKNEEELSIQDSKTAYEMCLRALTDYYKAVWNGTDIELDAFIDNESLKQYLQRKIQSQIDLHAQSKDPVQNVEVHDWEVEYTDDVEGDYIYLLLPAHIKKTIGGFGEPTEFLIRNINGKLVIVDWYTGGKDTYDFMVRGENPMINNPNIWNDREWVKRLNQKQMEFSGSTR